MKELPAEKINLLRKNARSVVRELGLLNDAYFEIGITLAQRHLLLELASNQEPITAREIAKRLLLDKSTVSRLIAKSRKKGYITSTLDQKDNRKHFIQLSEIGKDTLNAFEPIAFNQTKAALQTLSTEEISHVCQGIALYAQGLKNSRLKSIIIQRSENEIHAIESLEEVSKQLGQSGYKLEDFCTKDEQPLYEIFQEVVRTGNQFPYENGSIEEFRKQFLSPSSQVFVCRDSDQKVIGGFYIKPNYSGRSSHIANAAYMIKSSYQRKGIGTLLLKSSLHIAKNLGFRAMQLNMVLSQNNIAIKLYQKFGFTILATIPEAIRNPNGNFQDGYIMYQKLV